MMSLRRVPSIFASVNTSAGGAAGDDKGGSPPADRTDDGSLPTNGTEADSCCKGDDEVGSKATGGGKHGDDAESDKLSDGEGASKRCAWLLDASVQNPSAVVCCPHVSSDASHRRPSSEMEDDISLVVPAA